MLAICLIVEAVGLGIIAWSFKAENKGAYSTIFRIGAASVYILAMLATPISVMLLTALLMLLFRPKLNLTLAGVPETILSDFRKSLPALTALTATNFNPGGQLRQAQQAANVTHSSCHIIDIEVIEVSARR